MGTDCVIQGMPKANLSYEAAMDALSSLITSRKRGDGSKRAQKFVMMFRYLKVLNLEQQISNLKIIHVAGTKGKGSTCAFTEAILRECGFRTGLFTSPHLIDVRERYRINGLDISEDNFLHYFWDCWNQLKAKTGEDLAMPPLFQFLTLLAFKIFLCEKVDVAIIEVGLGGRLDSTNVVKNPVVCGITSLGMDHMEILGDTIGKIASEKAGIFKPCVPAYTVPQVVDAMSVLREKASELKVHLEVASPVHPNLLNGLPLGLAGDHQFINAGLAVALCKCWIEKTKDLKVFSNGNLKEDMPEPFIRGLCSANLPGRAQIFHDKPKLINVSKVNENCGELIFYLDGAHSPESIDACANWFSKAVRDNRYTSRNGSTKEDFHYRDHSKAEERHLVSNKISKKILLFNCMEMRDPMLLLPRLFSICTSRGIHFSKALFVPGISSYHRVDSGAAIAPEDTHVDSGWQSTLQRAWEKIIHGKDLDRESILQSTQLLPSFDFLHGDSSENCSSVDKYVCSALMPSLPLTIKWLRECAKENPSYQLQVLVTGSLHLVGDVLKLLRR